MLDIIGTVEAVELRTTRIRSTSGELYIVPNGEVRVVRNLSRGLFSVANIKVMVATENLSSALQVLETIADTAQTKFPELTERPEVLSIEGAISNHTELTLAAKAAYGRGAQLRPQLMTIVSQAMHEAGVQIIS
jgi:small conductance mechanosensitive channel